jgi:hypothetical protein
MMDSARKTAIEEIEIVCYIDEDDDSYGEDIREQIDHIVVGPRIREMTRYWNSCFDVCFGDILCQMNDDCVLTTPGWDVMVEDAFAQVPDKIMLAHGSDVYGHGSNFGPHPFVHRRWVECLGYFIPPHYCSDFGDAHCNEIANMLGRRRFLNFNIEHRHFSHGMMELDENTADRLQRHREDDPETLYYSPAMQAERQRDAEKLAKLMDKNLSTKGWCPPHSNIRSAGMCPHCESLSTVAVGVGKFFCNRCGKDFVR